MVFGDRHCLSFVHLVEVVRTLCILGPAGRRALCTAVVGGNRGLGSNEVKHCIEFPLRPFTLSLKNKPFQKRRAIVQKLF